jgi:hypothetical protein
MRPRVPHTLYSTARCSAANALSLAGAEPVAALAQRGSHMLLLYHTAALPTNGTVLLG